MITLIAMMALAQDPAQLREIWEQIENAKASLDTAQELLGRLGTTDPPVDPPSGDRPTWIPEPPAVPEYVVPTLDDCEWTIEAGVARSTRGLPDIVVAEGEPLYLLGPAYQASREAGHELPITFGVYDDAGAGVLGGGWSIWSDRSIFVDAGEGYEALSLEIVGLDESCEVQISWDTRWGFPERLGLFNVGLRGGNDSFVIRANNGIGELILDGCWFLPSRSFTGRNTHASAMHIDNWDTLVLRNTKWRGELPSDPGINLREHVFYLKSCVGLGTWILDNDLRGGNRTGFQVRPQSGANVRPMGDLVILGNVSEGYGWNMGESPETFDGGSAITVWANPDGETWIGENVVTDAKYGCLMVGGQAPDRNWLNSEGFPIGPLYVWGNTFENAHVGRPGLPRRSAVAITGVEFLGWDGNNMLLNARLDLNNEWGMNVHGIANGAVELHAMPDFPVWSSDGTTYRPLTEAELEALLVP